MNKIQNLSDQFHRLINKAIEKEMVPRKLDNGELLYRIEIHVIAAIGENPEVNLTKLSEILGVTKGAVSQKVKILEKKQYIVRYKNQNNNKEILFVLTEKGKNVVLCHQNFHKQLNIKFVEAICNTNNEEFEKFIQILKIIEQHFESL